MLRIALVIGTRPEAIKLGPVYRALKELNADPIVVLTGQHGAILDPLIDLFSLHQRVTLDCQAGDGGLTDFSGRMLVEMGKLLFSRPFDALLVEGDTSSALIAALAAAYRKVPVGHVEAGLRTPDITEPFPEELNRRMISETSAWHFAPTPLAAANLRREGFEQEIHVVGNTVVDAALRIASLPETSAMVAERFPSVRKRGYFIVTAHRRESFGEPIREIGQALAALADRYPELDFIVPLHPNPNASVPLVDAIGKRPNIITTEPLPYQLMIGLISGAFAILTDSGGLQEEAPSFGVPVFVLRDVTERPEGVEVGCSVLVGTNKERILKAVARLVEKGIDHEERRAIANPYGDGCSASRIASILIQSLSRPSHAPPKELG